ncbi:hypothetical protein VO419_004311 [Vibrio parahaemolyticus]|nr:hypothetical protein [Vibrio parahaemolyticus]
MDLAERLRKQQEDKASQHSKINIEEKLSRLGKDLPLQTNGEEKPNKKKPKIDPQKSKAKIHSKKYRRKNLNNVPVKLFDMFEKYTKATEEIIELLPDDVDLISADNFEQFIIAATEKHLKKLLRERKQLLEALKSSSTDTQSSDK